jgi:hypothetical protein
LLLELLFLLLFLLLFFELASAPDVATPEPVAVAFDVVLWAQEAVAVITDMASAAANKCLVP